MVWCTYCGQSFTRDEHLERHILTHTNVKPFRCWTCHMSFARRDLLQRHGTVHGRDQNQDTVPGANGMIPKSAGRTPIACTNCAKTKTKCDKKFPCSRCFGRNLKCTLRPTRRATRGLTRIGVIADGAAPIPPPDQSVSVETIANLPQQENVPPPQQHPPLRPASSKNQRSVVTEDGLMQSAYNAPPPQFANYSTSDPPVIRSGLCPPLQTPANRFLPKTSACYDAFAEVSTDGYDPISSPSLTLDWDQMIQEPIGFNQLVEPQLLMGSNHKPTFEDSALPLDAVPSHINRWILPDTPDLLNRINPSLTTSEETPRVERVSSDMDLADTTVTIGALRNNTSQPQSILSATSSEDNHGEMTSIVAAQAAWSAFRCTPIIPSTSCPKTAKLNLERLEQTLKDHGSWNTWSPLSDKEDFEGQDHLTVMHLHESTRDKLLAIAQSFLHKALEIHREGTSHGLPSPKSGSNFVLLPPRRVLEYFLRSYANCFERYYPLTSKSCLDANALMHYYNDRAASLLLLMMIAQGAMVEARMLTGGLTEECRISLFDLIEKNTVMASDSIALHVALLFTVQGAWSGDKWQMDMAMGQRGMYLAMLQYSGALENPPSQIPIIERGSSLDIDHLWEDWVEKESRSRLVYSWIMVDQELALFHDTAPLFSVTECATPLPDADQLWHAKTGAEWSSIFELAYSSVGSRARPLSLRDLFRHFLLGEIFSFDIKTTPLHLRLLLHPLQSQCFHLTQLLRSFSELPRLEHYENSCVTTVESTHIRLQEMQTLLQRWFDLAEQHLKLHFCPMIQTSLVIFHLISLNIVSNFAEVERLARRENVDGTYEQVLRIHIRCIFDVEEAIFHCGQVLRLVRAMPKGIRPPWWSGAIYRVALLLWTEAFTRRGSTSTSNSQLPVPGPSFAIDALEADHPLIVRYLRKREGVPCLTKNDGSQMGIDDAVSVLQHCIGLIRDGAATRFSDGIRMKLELLASGC